MAVSSVAKGDLIPATSPIPRGNFSKVIPNTGDGELLFTLTYKDSTHVYVMYLLKRSNSLIWVFQRDSAKQVEYRVLLTSARLTFP